MANFKITSAKQFKGMPSSMAGTTNQIVSVKDSTFYSGDLGRGLKTDKIVLAIKSRIYIDEASCSDVDAKEAEIVTLKESLQAKSIEWMDKVDEYKASSNPAHAAEARALQQEGTALELEIKAKVAAIDTTVYYEHITKLELENATALATALADTRAAVKADALFTGDTLVDL